MLIPLKEYAARHGKNPDSARHLAQRGSLQTACKIGRDWLVDENEPWPDRRIKSGAYIGFRRKMKDTKKKSAPP